jgi:hypothetical protein
LLFTATVFAQENSEEKDQKELESSIQLLRNYFSVDKNWQVVEPELDKNVNGLINFIEDQPLDDIIRQLNNAKLTQGNYVLRLPENVEDSLSVSGYVSAPMVQQNIEKIRVDYKNEVKLHEIMVPTSVIEQAVNEVITIPQGKGIQLFIDSTYTFPDSLIIPEVIPDSVLNSTEQFNQLVRIDSIRNDYIENKRQVYNDSVKTVHINAMVRKYRQERYEEGLNFRIRRYKDSIKLSNYQTLSDYNNEVVAQVNDTIKVRKSPITKSLKVLALAEKRMGAKLISDFVEDVTPVEEMELLEMQKHMRWISRDRGTGRPTKKDRRELDDFFDI